ncbi:hypothetical protein SAMN05660831_01506 [Thiohalospira halophila DSM 15071]|uniref:Outer membrane protein beta-barrel domain-containing protein n=1 Tax=Thiohalospira halophila DSM 15071 TaxID=1123397 RepID=A0A1I1RXN6_9GAMM|nr:hypothetical protein [Thiohalospira halophila]SFD35430.1 hypothetical protein SAMN05660831_01506 [Thiohalospira halophila DSM 15071]
MSQALRPALSLLLLMPVTAPAAGFNYHYTEGRGAQVEHESGVSGTAWRIEQSKDTGNRRVVLEYGERSWDNDIESSRLGFGLGWISRYDRNAELRFEARYLRLDVDAPAGLPAGWNAWGGSGSGFEYSAGLRFATDRTVELDAGIHHQVIGEDNTGYHAGLLFNLNRRITLGVQWQTDDYTTARGAQLRWRY